MQGDAELKKVEELVVCLKAIYPGDNSVWSPKKLVSRKMDVLQAMGVPRPPAPHCRE